MIENKYVPCLLHKKMCGPDECDERQRRYRMRIALGWGMPNKKVQIIFQTKAMYYRRRKKCNRIYLNRHF
jgi:hypothetical protein